VQQQPFHDYIKRMCIEQNETRAHIIRRAGIDRTYGHQLFNGTRMPSRDKVIQLAFGFGLDLERTQALLEVARKSRLSPQVQRDAAILYAILHNLDVAQTQRLLKSYGMRTLGTRSI
jgi:transcriptional regulator with XRE-family HTH domain